MTLFLLCSVAGAAGGCTPAGGRSDDGARAAERMEAPLLFEAPQRAPSPAGTADGATVAAWREASERAGIPLLIPKAETWPAGPRVMAGDVWLAWTLHGDGVHVALHATRTVHVLARASAEAPRPAPNAQVRGHSAFAGVEEEGVAFVSWEEQGAGWMLDVQCDAAGDPRCGESDFARRTADSLVDAFAEGGVP